MAAHERETGANEMQERQNQNIRALVTVAAVIFAFGGGLLMLILPAVIPMEEFEIEFMRESFLIVLPIAASAITFWFTSRK